MKWDSLPVLFKKLNLSQTETNDIKEKIKSYRDRYPESNESNVKAWHSNWRTDLIDNSFEDINNRIVFECENLISNQTQKNVELKLCDMWINMYQKGDYSQEHCHYPFNFSCCYYIDIEKNASPLEFPHLKVIPENDLLVLFPGSLKHKVAPTNGERVLISMNLNPEVPPFTYH